ERMVLYICRLLVRFYDILESESQFLGAGIREELPKLGQQLAELYSTVATICFDLDIRIFKMNPKLHLFEHLCEFQSVLFGNPRYWWTYADEDLVGRMIEIAESVHPTTLAASVLFKW
ncbi:unnamed protein product, partial [Prorocentrum cordatum]